MEEENDENAHSSSSSSSSSLSHKWAPDEDAKLGQAIKEFGSMSWKVVSQYVGTRSPIQCLHRWQRYLKPGLKKGVWTAEEDEKLLSLYQHWGKDGSALYKNWGALSNHMEGRSSKQCRERYNYYLSPCVNRSDFSSEEDKKLLEIHNEIGNKWAEIANQMVGRTDALVKARYRLLKRSSNEKTKEKKTKAKSTPTDSGNVGQKQNRNQKLSNKKNDASIPSADLALHDLASTALESHSNELFDNASNSYNFGSSFSKGFSSNNNPFNINASGSSRSSNIDIDNYTDTPNINNLIHAHMTMFPNHIDQSDQQFLSNLSQYPPHIQAQIIQQNNSRKIA